MIVGSEVSWLTDEVLLVSMTTTDCAEGFSSYTEGYLVRLDEDGVQRVDLDYLPDDFDVATLQLVDGYFLLGKDRLFHLEQGLIPVERGTVFLGWLGGEAQP